MSIKGKARNVTSCVHRVPSRFRSPLIPLAVGAAFLCGSLYLSKTDVSSVSFQDSSSPYEPYQYRLVDSSFLSIDPESILGIEVVTSAPSYQLVSPESLSTAVESLPRPEMVSPVPSSPLPRHLFNQLFVNNDKSFRAVAHVSREKGIQDLYHLLEKPVEEEAWIYVPSSERWNEIGLSSTQKGVRMDLESISQLLEDYPVLEFAHIHPVISSPSETPEDLLAIARGLPSSEDLQMFLEATIHQRAYWNSHKSSRVEEVNFRSFIVSPLGETKFFLTDAGVARYFGAHLQSPREYSVVQDLFDRDLQLGSAAFSPSETYTTLEGKVAKIQEICSQLSSPYLQVQFLPRD